MASQDLSQLQAFLNGIQHTGGADPVVVNDATNDTAGMSFAELFSHYLAPEVAKLPPSSLPPAMSTTDTPAAPFTFGDSVSPTASTSAASTSFDPSTFMPHIPGSPIGTFSPSSASDGRSPMSFQDLDFLNTTDPSVVAGSSAEAFSIDPSIFNPPSMFEPLPAVNAAASLSFDPAALPAFAATGAPLPPLPSLPLAPPSAPIAAPTEFLAPPLPSATASSSAVTTSGRPKRNVAAMVIPEEEEEEDDFDSDGGHDSDATTASVATTSATPSTRKSTRAKKPAAKKARSSSSSSTSAGVDSKKLPKTSVQPLASETLHKTTAKSALPPVPQWADKPDPEEYAKLSSKEKRQLRNKLSARNFRHRRKEYITTLEDEISTRDTLISTLRDEVGVMRAENTGLRTEVQTLKEKWQDLLDKLSSMTGAAPASPVGTAAAGLGVNPSRMVAAAAAAGGAASPPFTIKQEDGVVDPSLASPQLPPSTQGNARRHGTRSQIQLPNLSKDVGASGRRFAGGLGSGGFMSVHTTLVPDVGAQLAEGLNPKPPGAAAFNPFSSQSFNPALNALTAAGRMDDLASYTSHLRSSPLSSSSNSANAFAGAPPPPPKGTFEDFFASNPFWLRPDQLDQSRAALYGKLANNAAGIVAAQKQQQQQQGGSQDGRDGETFLPLPNGFRPAFFRSSSKALPSSSSPSSSSSSSPTPASDLLAFQSPSTAAALGVSHQDALALRDTYNVYSAVAATAQKTLLQRMGGAFWDAFAGASEGKGKGQAREVDPKKVAAVLSGQARVEVVPVVPVEKKSSIEDLGAALGALNLRSSRSPSPSPAPSRSPGLDQQNSPCAFDEVCRVWTAPPAPPAAQQAKRA
ncbi:hypothetical protein JCM11251_007456 [Rhodosporidiobolus azoricus]